MHGNGIGVRGSAPYGAADFLLTGDSAAPLNKKHEQFEFTLSQLDVAAAHPGFIPTSIDVDWTGDEHARLVGAVAGVEREWGDGRDVIGPHDDSGLASRKRAPGKVFFAGRRTNQNRQIAMMAAHRGGDTRSIDNVDTGGELGPGRFGTHCQ